MASPAVGPVPEEGELQSARLRLAVAEARQALAARHCQLAELRGIPSGGQPSGMFAAGVACASAEVGSAAAGSCAPQTAPKCSDARQRLRSTQREQQPPLVAAAPSQGTWDASRQLAQLAKQLAEARANADALGLQVEAKSEHIAALTAELRQGAAELRQGVAVGGGPALVHAAELEAESPRISASWAAGTTSGNGADPFAKFTDGFDGAFADISTFFGACFRPGGTPAVRASAATNIIAR